MRTLSKFFALFLIASLSLSGVDSLASGPSRAYSPTSADEFASQALAARWSAGGLLFFAKPHRQLSHFLRSNFIEQPWRDRNILFGGSIISNVGFGLQLVAEPYLVFELTNSESAVGLVTMAIPLGMLLSPLGGMLAGHLSNRGLIIVQFFRLLPPLIVGTWFILEGSIPPAIVVCCSGLTGIGQAVGFPLYQNMLHAIMKKNSDREIERATAASFLLFGIAMYFLKTPLQAKKRGASSEPLGAAIRQDPTLILFLILLALATGLGYPIFSLLAPAVKNLLHVGPDWQSRLQSLFMVGSLTGSMVWGSHKMEYFRKHFFLASLFLLGGCSVVLAFGVSVKVAMVLEGLAGFSYAWASLLLMGAIQTSVRKEFMPRTFGLLYFFWYFGQAVGNMSAGHMAHTWGVAPTLRSFGSSLMFISMGVWLGWGKRFKVAQAKGLWAQKTLPKAFFMAAAG